MANVRVELRDKRSGSFEEQRRAFMAMLADFRKKCDESGIKHEMKRYEVFESKGEKRRRKQREYRAKAKQENLIAAVGRGECPKEAVKFLRKGKKKKNRSSQDSNN